MHALARCWAPLGVHARGPVADPNIYAAIWNWRPRFGRKSAAGDSSASGEDPDPVRERPRGGALGQIALVIGAWFAYSLARSLSGDDVAAAMHRGRELQHWDSLLGFGWTIDLNHWITNHALFAVPMTLEYASLHYLVTPVVLVWLWRAHPEMYRSALLALIAMSATGLVVYIGLPVAPPRLLPGSDWVDTMSAWSHIGWWGAGASAPAGFEHLTDQYAAMPSLHVGWAVWCAWAWRRAAGHSFVRRFAWIYPTTVGVTVIATANHYVLDVAVGAVLALAACALAPRVVARWQARKIAAAQRRAMPSSAPVRGSRTPAPRPVLNSVVVDLIKVIDLRDRVSHQRDSVDLVDRVDLVGRADRIDSGTAELSRARPE